MRISKIFTAIGVIGVIAWASYITWRLESIRELLETNCALSEATAIKLGEKMRFYPKSCPWIIATLDGAPLGWELSHQKEEFQRELDARRSK